MRILFLLLGLGCLHLSQAQSNYFQQQVDYQINVSLDDQDHILRGFEKVTYQNNSKDTLKFIFFHLWPNAYKNDQTAFTQQLVENGKKAFYFSSDNAKGFIDSLDFHVNDIPVNVSNFNDYEDVVLLELPEPLYPGKSMQISTPFRVVLPEIFSRLGHDDQYYQINQWYPKPAVYDPYGWHPMPYLDQGEFYSEYGSFEVSITLPESYWVAATGELQNAAEQLLINRKIGQKDSVNRSDTATKKLVFKQNNIHDFAWFACKDFLIEKEVCTLKSGKKIDCYAYYLPKHKKMYEGSTAVVGATLQYYSDRVGDYPYSHATIVDGRILEGAGGMEYPMVTNIGQVSSKSELQTVIIHEVGHNWFYGILGSNERDYAWLDEGINSFYEHALDKNLSLDSNKDLSSKLTQKLEKIFDRKFIYDLALAQQEDQPIEIPSTYFTSLNYGGMVYAKAPIMLNYLEAYLTTPVFDRGMKKYFEVWKYKHPYPSDFRKIMEAESGKSLSWFFNDLMQTSKDIDFKITKVTDNVVKAKSTTSFKGPIPVSGLDKDSVIETQWIEYPYQLGIGFTRIYKHYQITTKNDWVDANPKNSVYKQGLLPRYQLKLGLGFGFGKQSAHKLIFIPSAGFNLYNKWMLGIGLHNLQIPNQNFQYAIAPMYSFGSKSWVGTGFMAYSFYPEKQIHKVTLALQGKTFHDHKSSVNIQTPLFTRYVKLNPQVILEFRKPFPRSSVSRSLAFKYYAIANESFKYSIDAVDSLPKPKVEDFTVQHYAQVVYRHQNQRTFNPFSYSVVAEGNPDYVKLGLNTSLKVDYHYRNKAFYVRFYGGKFFTLQDNANAFLLRDRNLTSTHGANNDYLYNETYLARQEQKGILSQQIASQEGGLKLRTPFLASPIGINDNWLMALNFRSDLPIKSKIKLQVFFDVATFNQAAKLNPSGSKALYMGGAELHLFKDFLVVYAPLLLSKDYKNYVQSTFSKNRFLQTMSFSFNVSRFNFLHTQSILNSLF